MSQKKQELSFVLGGKGSAISHKKLAEEAVIKTERETLWEMEETWPLLSMEHREVPIRGSSNQNPALAHKFIAP